MSDLDTVTVSESGYQHTSEFGDYDLIIDAVGDAGPRAREALLATYASCFQGSFRIGAEQRGHGELGRIRTHTRADIDADDHLDAIEFTMEVEADLDEEAFNEILDRAKYLCHVNNALADDLQADIEVVGDAF